jgi:hypothetical protein
MAKRKQFYHPLVDPRDERIKRLEDELWSARNDIVCLMPDDISDLLMGYHFLKTRPDYYRWQRETIEAIVAMALPDPKASHFQNRARCPLCNRSGDVYGSGFTLPIGLERHLEGFGNVSQCPATEAAFKNARNSKRDEFDDAEKVEREGLQQRKTTERVVLIDPTQPPLLFDEHLWTTKPRSPEQLATAEQRLRDLGFEIEINGNVVAYRLVNDEWLVLADPRAAGRIDFAVFNQSGKKRKRRMLGRDKFYLLDSWSADLPGKFRKRLHESCEDVANENNSPAGQ